MTTADGRLVTQHNLGVPTPRDLATSLGRVPRFVGHTRLWWTVLHHVAHVYKTLERFHVRLNHRPYQLHVLLHDSEEGILGDLPTPWKGPKRRELEERLCSRIQRTYGGPWPEMNPETLADWNNSVRAADEATLRVECMSHGPPRVEYHSGLAYLPIPRMMTQAQLAYAEVMHMKHDPFEPAESELGLWFLHALEEAVGNPSHWKLLTQVAP